MYHKLAQALVITARRPWCLKKRKKGRRSILKSRWQKGGGGLLTGQSNPPHDIQPNKGGPPRLENLDNGAQHADNGAGLGDELQQVGGHEDALGGALEPAAAVGLDALARGGGGEQLRPQGGGELVRELGDELLERVGQLVEALCQGAVLVVDDLHEVVVGGGHAVDEVLEDVGEGLEGGGRVGADDLVVLDRQVEAVEDFGEVLLFLFLLRGRRGGQRLEGVVLWLGAGEERGDAVRLLGLLVFVIVLVIVIVRGLAGRWWCLLACRRRGIVRVGGPV